MSDKYNVEVTNSAGKLVNKYTVDRTTAAGHPVMVKALPGETFKLVDASTGKGPKVFAGQRHGNDLQVSMDQTKPGATPDIVVQDYYKDCAPDGASKCGIVGEADTGGLKDYHPNSATDATVMALADNGVSPQALGAPVEAAPAADGNSYATAGVIGLTMLAVGAAIAAGGSSSGGSGSPPPAAGGSGTGGSSGGGGGTTPTAVASLGSTSDSGTSATDHITNVSKPAFTAPAGTGVAGQTVTLYSDGVAVGTAVVAADGSFSVAPTAALADGTHAMTYAFTDSTGTTTAQSPATSVTIDTIAPVATAAPVLATADDSGTNHADQITNVTHPHYSVTAQTGDTVTLFIDGVAAGTAVATTAGALQVAPTAALADGVHAVTYTITDAAGNTSTVSPAASVTIDTHVHAATTGADAAVDG